MSKLFLSAPLPFVGQKRMFAKHFIEVIKQYPEGTVFVDLFGGSGLLSHITKHYHPESRVIYNDFDNYRHRIDNIPRTNRLLSLIRSITDQFPRHKPITGEARARIFELLEQEERENGYPMKKGKLYKMTSDPQSGIPFYKLGNKLHFKKDELLVWAESKLVSGNAVGYLSSADTKKKGGRR